MKRIESVNDFVIKFANVNGSGSASANEIFAKAILRMGVPVSPRNIFPSNIQGLPTWYEVRVSELAARIAQEMGLGDYYVQAIRQAGLVHDLGKMHVPSAILLKPGTLSAQETELVRSHPDRGHDILKDISFPWPVADVVWEHHERMDGSGYPRGLKGENISLLARVVAVADVLDATAAERSYHSAATMQEAFEGLIAKPYGFDPRVVSACARLHERGEL